MRAQLAALACVLGLAAPPAGAAPDVQMVLAGSATVYVDAGRGVRYRVIVFASIATELATTDESSVHVLLFRCAPKCGMPTVYGASLRPAEYDVSDETAWSVTTTAFGRPLRLQWRGPGTTGGTPSSTTVAGTSGGTGIAWPAEATVSVLGRSCVVPDASAQRGVVFFGDGRTPAPGFPSRLPRGVPSAGRTCRAT